MIYGTIGGNSQIEFSFEQIAALYNSIKNYTGIRILEDLYTHISSNNNLITDWYNSEYGRLYVESLENLHIDSHIQQLQYTIVMENNEETRQYQTSLSFMEQNNGAYAIITNLVKYFKNMIGNTLAKSTGSGSDASITYKVIVKSILNGRKQTIQNTNTNRIKEFRIRYNSSKEKFLDPNHGYKYCTANIHCELLHQCDKYEQYKHLIIDQIVDFDNIKEFISKFIRPIEKQLKIKIQLEELITFDEYSYKIIIHNRRKPKEEFFRIVLNRSGVVGHAYLGFHKPNTDPEGSICPNCNKWVSIENTRHAECEQILKSHKHLSAIHEISSHIKKYSLNDLENLDNDYISKKGKIIDCIQRKECVFLTGYAGNGKTWLLNDIINTLKNDYSMQVVAPTGIAASDYNHGKTWHSFFKETQISYFDANNTQTTQEKKSLDYLLDRNNEGFLIKAIEKYSPPYFDVLIIEEASMISGIQIEFINRVCQIIFNNNEYFGGKSVIICGDPGQLPPVEKDKDYTSLYFASNVITQIRMHHTVIELNHPRRLLQYYDPNHNLTFEEKKDIVNQTNILLNIRSSILDEGLFDYIKHINSSAFNNLLFKGNFLEGDDFIAVKTNDDKNKILQIIFKELKINIKNIGTDFNGANFKIYKGMKLIVCNNQTIPYRDDIVNGTPCIVEKWDTIIKIEYEKDKSGNEVAKEKKINVIQVKFKDGSTYWVEPGQGTMEYKNRFPLTTYHVRTIHKLQGVTVSNKIYFIASHSYKGSHIKENNEWNCGQFYTLISRVTNLNNVIIVTEPYKKLKDYITKDICANYDLTLKVLQDPTVLLPYVNIDKHGNIICVNKINYCEFIKVRDISTIGNIHDRKIHIDSQLTENEKIFNNSIIFDHETGFIDNSINQHKVTFTCCRFYFNGKQETFKNFIERNGGNVDNLPLYRIDEKGDMIFSDIDMNNPQFIYHEYIFKMLECVKNGMDRHTESKSSNWDQQDIDIEYWSNNPLQFIGYNNKNYDDWFLLQELIEQRHDYEISVVPGNGSNLKKISFPYKCGKKRVKLCESFDLMQTCSVSTLEKQIESNVFDNIDKMEKHKDETPFKDNIYEDIFYSLNSLLWIKGKTPYGHILDDLYPGEPIEYKIFEWNQLDDEIKTKCCESFASKEYLNRTFKNGKKFTFDNINNNENKNKALRKHEKMVINFAERCKNSGQRDLLFLNNLKQHKKKGNVPLKLYCNKSAQWRREHPTVDLIQEMTDKNGNIDYSIAFFNPDKGEKCFKEYCKNYGVESATEIFRNYPLNEKIEEYGINDVVLTELLLRVKNNSFYKFGTVGDGLPCAKFDHSWDGLALSFLRFNTISETTLFLFYINLDDIYLDLKEQKKNPLYICTKLPIMPKCLLETIKNVSGGKTQVRRLLFKSKDNGDNDFLLYLDISGMYSFVQINSDYPYGRIKVYSSETSTEINKFKQQYDNAIADNEEIFTRCRTFVIKGKCRDDELENVVACKSKNLKRLKYANTVECYTMTNYELRLFKKFGGIIIDVLQVIEWEFQGPMLSKICKYYDYGKQHAKDDVVKNDCKAYANTTFGSLLKTDKDRHYYMATNPDDLKKAFNTALSTSTGGLQNMQICGEFSMFIAEDTDNYILRNPSYIGIFTLGGSKALLYDYLYIAMGKEDRFYDFNNMFGYGDTDSITLSKIQLQRMIDYEHNLPIDKKILFNGGDDKTYKNGKFLDELADDCKKYVGEKYDETIDKSFPKYDTGYHARILEAYNPQSKSGCNKFIFPPTHWKDGRKTNAWDYPQPSEEPWLYGYKNFIKGIRKQDPLKMLVDPYHNELDNIPGIYKETIDGNEYYCMDNWSCNEQTFEYFKYSNEYSLSIKSFRDSKLTKKLFLNNMDRERGIRPFDIINEKNVSRQVWGCPNNGRIPVYRTEFAEQNPNLLTYSIPELARMGYPLSTVTEGFTVPEGYKGLPIYHSPIEHQETTSDKRKRNDSSNSN